MHASKRLTQGAILLWLLALVLGSWDDWFTHWRRTSEWVFFKQRVEMLDHAPPGPRILIIGSSPSLYGLSAEQIGKGAGLPAYNLSGVNIRPLLDDDLAFAATHLRPGDIVVFSNPHWLAPDDETTDASCARPPLVSCVSRQLRFNPQLGYFALLLAGQYHIGPRSPFGDWLQSQVAAAPDLAAEDRAPVVIEPKAVAATIRMQAAMVRRQGAVPLFAFSPRRLAPAALDPSIGYDALLAELHREQLDGDVFEQSPFWQDGSLMRDSDHPSLSGRDFWSAAILHTIAARGLARSTAQ